MCRLLQRLISFVLTACVITSTCSGGPIRKVAFLVGAEEYQKAGFSRLDYAEDDVIELGRELKQQGFEVLVLLGSGQEGGQATWANFQNVFNEQFVPKLRQLNKSFPRRICG